MEGSDRRAHDELLDRTGTKGVNPVLFRIVRLLFVPFFLVYFRLGRVGREHVPAEGPVIFAANHRSFLDPFVISAIQKRPLYFVAKRELFEKSKLQRWFLNALGAFPIDRGSGDDASMAVARKILERGDGVMIFPEGTRVRPGPLGHTRSGVGRLALETGAPVVPIAVFGTDDVRRGLRVYPRRITIRAGRPLTFPRVENPSRALSAAVAERIWPCVELQWEWLGGTPPVRRVAIVGAGAQAFEHAIALHEVFGAQVDLVGRDAAQVRSLCQRLVQQGIAACVATDVHDALDRGFDAVITATNSRAPVLPPSVPSEVLVVAIGAFTPEMIEVPAGVVLSRQVVVDTLEGARHEAGDLIQAGVDWSRVHALAACLGADRPQHNVLFKTVGHAAWDLAAAAVALDSPINLNRADSN